THVETSLSTQKPVRIIPGPAGIVQQAKLLEQRNILLGWDVVVKSTQEYMKKVVEDVGEDEDFKRGLWVSATDYVNANGGISCSPNVIDDLTVTMKDLSGAALILANVLVFSPKPSMHNFNIKMRNVVKVFHKDTVPGSDSGVGRSGMLMEEEAIVKLMEDEEMVDLELQVCENITDQEMTDEEALNLALEEEARQA
ncbi:hypothetical protein Tco_0203660, partial [Tanacetum coccineum]